MEIRKVQKTQAGSFTVTLPKCWADQMKLKRGDKIALSEEEDGMLRLYPMEKMPKEPLATTLSIENFSDFKDLKYCIDTYYMQGCGKIRILSKQKMDEELKAKLKHIQSELPGAEVAEEEVNRFVLQVIIDPALFSLESLIRKTSSLSLGLQKDAVRSVLKHDSQLANEVVTRSKEALRHYRMVIRQLAVASLRKAIAEKVGVRNCQECVTFALVARDLNRVIYHSSSIARYFQDNQNMEIDKAILDGINDMSRVAYEMQHNAVQAFLKKDVQLAIFTMKMMVKMKEKEEALLAKISERIKNVNVAITLSGIARHLRRISGYSVAMADDAMNRILTPAS